MKRIILTAATLALTGPAFAASQLEMLHGVSPDAYTPAQLAELHFSANTQGGVPKYYETKGTLVISTTNSVHEETSTKLEPSEIMSKN